MRDKILSLLKKEKGFISGEELSQLLGLTRAGIWKQISQLRELGYEIEAIPHLGYRLKAVPDLLLPEEITWQLHTRFMGKKIFCYDRVDSTMDIAYELGIKAVPEGTVVTAESQKKGRGRMGRTWHSPKRKGLYFSLILRPDISPYEAPKLTILSSVAVSKAIRDATGLPCLIKWPNDILLNDKKIGGILTEMQAETDKIKFMVIGIGINVNTEKTDLPPRASSLREELGKEIERISLLKHILEAMEMYYVLFQKEGFSPIAREWRRHSAILGHHVKIISHHRIIEGQAIELDSDGTLLVRKDAGFIEKVSSGDVLKVR